MRKLVLLGILGVGGCTGAGETTVETTQAVGEENNGRFMLSEILDRAPYDRPNEYFSVALNGTGVKFAGKASLSMNGRAWNDPSISAINFDVAEGITMSLSVAGGDASVTHYKLVTHVRSLPPAVVCTDAVPLSGVIRHDGLHVPDSTKVTLACYENGHGGAAAKCIVWHYPPGPGPGPMWNVFQACIRAVPADYCAKGQPHTRIGTAIEFLDTVGVSPIDPLLTIGDTSTQVWPPPPNQYFFEAAFAPGAQPAVCVRRLRWEGLPLGPACEDAVEPDPAVLDCDDPSTTMGNVASQGAVLFVGSKFNTLALDVWKRNAVAGGRPTDITTTISGYHNAEEQRLRRPMQAYGVYEHVRNDGILLRVPPDGLETPVTAVYTYRERSSDRFVLSTEIAPFNTADFEMITGEGWVYDNQQPQSSPLRLYRHPGGDYLSTTGDAPAGYVPFPDAAHNTLGWIRTP